MHSVTLEVRQIQFYTFITFPMPSMPASSRSQRLWCLVL